VLIGVLLALVTSVSWAFGNVLIQRSGRQVGAARAMLWALASGGVVSGLCALLFDTRIEPIRGATIAWAAAAGLAGLFAYAGLFYAVAWARLSLAVPLIGSWSLVSGILSVTVFGERLTGAQVAGAACVLGGVVLVSIGGSREPSGSSDGEPRALGGKALLAALVSGLGFGVMIPTSAHVSGALGAFGASAVVYAAGIAVAVPVGLAFGVNLRPPSSGAWGLVILIGLCETLGYVAVNLARLFAPMAVVSPVASLSSAFTVLYAWIFLRELPNPLAAIGAVLASVGLIVLAL